MDRLALMNWRSSTHIKEFSLSKIPSSMNISRLNREFFYYPDGAGDQYLPVPNVRPASINWMLANSELTERQIARLRNRAGSTAPVVVDSGDEPDFGDYRGRPSLARVSLFLPGRYVPMDTKSCPDRGRR